MNAEETPEERLGSLLASFVYTAEKCLSYLEAHPGINPNHVHNGDSLLILAAQKHSLPLIKQLIDMGADIRVTSNNGNTLLHACLNSLTAKYPEVALWVLQHTALVSHQNKSGYTPLHFYAMNYYDTSENSSLNEALIDALITAPGFDPDTPNKNGKFPIEMAIAGDHVNAFGYRLMEEGARIPFSVRTHDELGSRYVQAERRWKTFLDHPDVTTLTRNDLILFANLGTLTDAFSFSLWKDHPDLLLHHMASLPARLSEHILETHPELTAFITPLAHICTPALASAIQLPAPKERTS